LGELLGCGAHLTALTRLACGSFKLSEAIDLDQFAATVTGRDQGQPEAPEGWHRLIVPMDPTFGA
jgi:tRNA U55 pseudouridine synthase TruB